MPHVRERRLACKLRRHQMGLHAIAMGRRAVLILVIIVILGPAIEVNGTLVLVWTAVLHATSQKSGSGRRSAMSRRLTNVYLVIRSRISHDEYS